MTKPFEMVELVARVSALLRRSAVPAAPESEGIVEFGGVRVDRRSAEVSRKGERVLLSAREFQLLRYLVDHRGETVTREDLLREVWGYQPSTMTRTVDVHMTWAHFLVYCER
jgi:two-component system alkaline phosphatase synthesis response regulator PhoP